MPKPDYYDVVSTPIDLATIKYKVESEGYKGAKALTKFGQEMKLLLNKCENYEFCTKHEEICI